MGDRATVVFHTKKKYFSPGIYLHWGGDKLDEYFEAALPRLRHEDHEYSAARFCGVCHEMIEGNRSLGLWHPPKDWSEATDNDEYSPGDAGVFLVDVETWEVECWNGYGWTGADGNRNGFIEKFQLDVDKVGRE